MNTKLVWWIGGVLGSAVIAGVLIFLVFLRAEPAQTGQQTTTSLPISETAPMNSTSSPTVQPGSTGSLSIADSAGKILETLDFTRNGSAAADESGSDRYIFAGTSGDGFSIVYYATGQYFIIALEREPLGEIRGAAEKFLQTKLGISHAQLCGLKYYVGTDVHTNSQYSSKNLGFSFCPGATVLPK